MNDLNPNPSRKAKIIGFLIVLVVVVALWALFSDGSSEGEYEEAPPGLSS